MCKQSSPYYVSLFQSGSRTFSAAVIVVGAISLLGWILDVPILMSFYPGLVAMKANTATAFVLSGVSLWLLQPGKTDGSELRIARCCAGGVTLLGLLTLGEYISGLDFGIDQLLFREQAGAVGTLIPGRMAPNTALNFVLLGLALMFPDSEIRKRYRPSQFLAIGALALAFLALIGYALDVEALRGISSYTNMALNTMLAFLALSLGILWARPEQGLMALLTGNGAGAKSARHLLPAVTVIPVALGLLHISGVRTGQFASDFGLSLMVLLNVLFLVLLVWWDCRCLERMDAERRQIEESLRVSEDRFRGAAVGSMDAFFLFEAVRDGLHRITDFEFVDMNSRGEKLVGIPRENVIGRNLCELIPINRTGGFFEKYVRVVETGETLEEEFPISTQEINAGWLHHQVVALANGVAITSRDITERKRDEEERQTSVEFLHLVNESQNSADLIRGAMAFFYKKSGCEAVGIRLREGDDYPYFEAQGFPEEFVLLENRLCDFDENGEVIRDSAGNPVIACMCGNVICEKFDPSKPFFTSHGSFWTNCTSELLAGTTESDRQTRTRNRCNGEGYESVALIPLSMGEERLGLLQLNDRKQGRFSPAAIALWERLSGYLSVALTKFRAEESIYEMNITLKLGNAQLAVANKEMEAFNYSVSHDLRSPLRALDGFSHVLLEEYADKLDGDGLDHLRRIRAASRRMGQLIDDLLELSRVSRRELSRKMVDMSAMVCEITDELRGTAPQRQADFMIAPGLMVDADPWLLRITLDNLLGNAWKFTGKRPDARIEFGCREEGGCKSYFVRDNGVGFDMAYAGKLFGSFQRLHAIDEFPGTGIGLATVQRIVQRHGGHAWAEGELDKGATIYFTLAAGC